MKKIECYQCELWFLEMYAAYFPFGMSDNPFKPLCPTCSDLIEAVIQ
jgi:hypothetical protein